jgi:xylulokinase
MTLNRNNNLERFVIGLDCSTTAAKAIAFDNRGKVVARAVEPIPLLSPKPNWYEQDSSDWWLSARRALREVTRCIDPRRIASLAIANQRETFVALDRKGRPLRRAVLWLDERCKEEVEPFARMIGRTKVHRITGKPPDYAPVVYRLAWMKRHEPRLFRRIGMICDVQTYIVWKLTGRFRTSWASADPLGLFDMKRKNWSAAILDALRLTRDQLPVVCAPGTVLGSITADVSQGTGLRVGTTIVAGGGDGQSAGLGSNVLTSKRAYLNLGTAVVAGVYGSQYKTSLAFRTMSSCTGRGYYYECSLRAGTFALDWLIRNMLRIDPSRQPDIYRQLEREAEQVPAGSDGLMFLPYVCGVMNPYWDMNARGVFTGLSSSQSRGHLYRSILEGIAFEQLLAIEKLEQSVGTTVREFVAIGGGATSRLWLHIFADVTGRDICIPEATEASALGAGIAAAVGAGWYASFRSAAREMTRIAHTIKPNSANVTRYRRLLPIYRNIYPSLRR